MLRRDRTIRTGYIGSFEVYFMIFFFPFVASVLLGTDTFELISLTIRPLRTIVCRICIRGIGSEIFLLPFIYLFNFSLDLSRLSRSYQTRARQQFDSFRVTHFRPFFFKFWRFMRIWLECLRVSITRDWNPRDSPATCKFFSCAVEMLMSSIAPSFGVGRRRSSRHHSTTMSCVVSLD